MNKIKRKAAIISVVSNSTLIAFKLIIGLITGSISIISEAIHSSMDLLASLITYFSVKISSKPADKTHTYGHGKVENISGVVESGLIFMAALFIIYSAIKKIMGETHLEKIELGLVVMFVSVIVNLVVSRYLFKVARESKSIALEADAAHLSSDVYTSLGVLAGLFIVKIARIEVLDPIIAIAIALILIKIAFQLTKKSMIDLVDQSLPQNEIKKISGIIQAHYGKHIGFHKFRSRKVGPERQIDLHLVVAKEMTVENAHNLSAHLENHIKNEFPNTTVTIHIEPCGENCQECTAEECQTKKEEIKK
ncbi:MAG: cation diffusion facilitator family transporter [Candidatus Aminicenantia bacterium]